MTPPSVYLIDRGLTEAKIQSLRERLILTPLEAVLIADLGDLEYARRLSDLHVSALSRPIGIVGDFEHDLIEIGDKTTCLTLPSPFNPL